MAGNIVLSYSTTSNGATTATVRITMTYYGNGVSWNSSPPSNNCSITLAGYGTKYFTHGFTTSSSAQSMGYVDFVVNKNHSAQSLSASGSMVTDVSLGTLTASTTVSVSAKTSYSVSYNANGGSGAPSAQTKWYGETLTLSTTKPTRTGYSFSGWYTASSGGSKYGTTYTANASAILYAHWTAITYTVAYNANGGENAPANQTKTYGVDLVLTETKPTRTGYSFSGWSTSDTGTVEYQSGGIYSANSAVILYAVWTQITYTVSYNANGGTGAPSNQTKIYGADLVLSDVQPTRAEHIFTGWSTVQDGEVEYMPNDTYTQNDNLELFAVWIDAYLPPKIINAKAIRCKQNGDERASGDYIKLMFDWESAKNADGTINPTNVSITGAIEYEFDSTESGGSVAQIVGLALGQTNIAVIVVTDTQEDTETRLSVPFPKGKAMIHANRTETAVKFFGIAEEDEKGVIIDETIKVNGNANISGNLDASESINANKDINVVEDIYLNVDETATSGTDYRLALALTDLGWEDLI